MISSGIAVRSFRSGKKKPKSCVTTNLFFYSNLDPYKCRDNFRKGYWGEEIGITMLEIKTAWLG